MDIPSKITCVDCGQLAYLMTSEPEFGFSEGDWVAYRCSGCGDRWDFQISEEIQKIAASVDCVTIQLHKVRMVREKYPFTI